MDPAYPRLVASATQGWYGPDATHDDPLETWVMEAWRNSANALRHTTRSGRRQTRRTATGGVAREDWHDGQTRPIVGGNLPRVKYRP
jgi:hypothetical protein